MNKKFRITALIVALIVATVVFSQLSDKKEKNYTPEQEDNFTVNV